MFVPPTHFGLAPPLAKADAILKKPFDSDFILIRYVITDNKKAILKQCLMTEFFCNKQS